MFQKKVPGYRKGGGIAYLARGGTSNVPVSGERTRILPRGKKIPGTALEIVKGQGPRTINPGPQSRMDRIKSLGRKGSKGIADLLRRSGPLLRSTAGPLALAGTVASQTTNPELDPFRKATDIRKPFGASLLGRGNEDETIERYVAGSKEEYNPSIAAGNLRRGLASILPGENPLLTGMGSNPNALRGGLNSQQAFDETIDSIKSQLGRGALGTLGSLFANTKAGEITTTKKISDWLDSNSQKLFDMSTTDEESARSFINSLTNPDGLKKLIQKEDPESFNEIFVGETIAETTPIPEDFNFDQMTKDAQEGVGKAIEEKRRKEALMQRAKDNKSTMDTYIREERIQGKPMDPKVEEKALMAAMYGGGPNATGFDYFKNADVTRIAEEEKADLLRLEQKKALGSGYEAPKSEEVIEGTGINIAFFQPSNPTLRGAQELITDNAYKDASQQIMSKLDVYARADDQINQLAAILEDGNPTSIGAKLKQGFSRAASALGADFDKQTDSAKYASIQKLIQTAFTSEFLNESGRTISDGDRALVEKIFAGIDSLTATGTNIETLKTKLEAVREVITGGSKAYNSAFNRINLANPSMASQFAQGNLTSEEGAELEDLDAYFKEVIEQQEAAKNG
tara:strand:- start:2542 stop:4422 length:1881 start_codon:yes stop_codon:yes gene_type:complete